MEWNSLPLMCWVIGNPVPVLTAELGSPVLETDPCSFGSYKSFTPLK